MMHDEFFTTMTAQAGASRDVKQYVYGNRMYTREGFTLVPVATDRAAIRKGATQGRVFELHRGMSADEMQSRINHETEEIEVAMGLYDGV
jgi:hypothetical protein